MAEARRLQELQSRQAAELQAFAESDPEVGARVWGMAVVCMRVCVLHVCVHLFW